MLHKLAVYTMTLLVVFMMVLQFLPCANADPLPPSWDEEWKRIRAILLPYAVVVIISEFIAWIVGAELLLKLLARLRKKHEESFPRSVIYVAMLIAMLVSLAIGFILWDILVAHVI